MNSFIRDEMKAWVKKFHAAYFFMATRSPHANIDMIRDAENAKDTILAVIEDRPWAR